LILLVAAQASRYYRLICQRGKTSNEARRILRRHTLYRHRLRCIVELSEIRRVLDN
jgi:hypothetical protein